MTPNDKLPEEIVEQIEQQAHDAASSLYSPSNYNEFTSFQSGYNKGATTWAEWKVRYDELKSILQEFVSNHEAGLLPNRYVYEKSIKILNDGTKEVEDTCRCILPNWNAFTGKCLTCGKQ